MSYSAGSEHDTGRLHILAEPSVAYGPSYDIIAIHGPGGSWDQTWTSDTGYKWLVQSLATRFPSCRVLSYDCPNLLQVLVSETGQPFERIAVDLSSNRQRTGRSQHPIVLISHSFGGILAKQLFVFTHSSRSNASAHRELHKAIYGFAFLGTPHKYYVPANIDDLWRTWEYKCEGTISSNSSELSASFEAASRVNDEFCRLGGENIPTICFYEVEMTWVGIIQMFIVPKDRALLRSRVVDGGGLVSNHFDLPKFDSNIDGNCVKFMSCFEKLMTILSDPIGTAQQPNHSSNRSLKLLSLDGGGVKGLFSVLVLQKILNEVRRLGDSTPSKRPCEYFDLIGGTSTGGLLAIMIGRLEMDIASCIKTYRDLSTGIFERNNWLPFKRVVQAALGQPWFSGDRLKDAVCSVVDQYVGVHERDSMDAAGLVAEDLRFLSIDRQKTRCFVCAIREGEHEAHILRSYRTYPLRGRDTSSYTIWQAARATSAAPMYFPAIDIQGVHYFDGGLSCNNPVLNVIDEARAEFPNIPISTIISIGTGKSRLLDPHGSVPNIISSVINRATDTEVQHDRIMKRAEFDDLRGGYFRFQEDDELGEIDLADADRMDEIEALAEKYLAKDSVKLMIASCARRLLDL